MPDIDIRLRSQYEKAVKVYDQNNAWVGDLLPLNANPNGHFKMRQGCLANGSS